MKWPAPLRRVAVLLVGGSILIAGLVMLVTPGPGVAVLLVGLATLATEFAWARRWLERLRAEGLQRGRQALGWWRRRRRGDGDSG